MRVKRCGGSGTTASDKSSSKLVTRQHNFQPFNGSHAARHSSQSSRKHLIAPDQRASANAICHQQELDAKQPSVGHSKSSIAASLSAWQAFCSSRRRQGAWKLQASAGNATHTDIQNKLTEMLSSLDEEDLSRDGFEDIPVDSLQTAASMCRTAYEVARLDSHGRTRRIYVKRRDLLRGIKLQPRDLRRIEPSLGSTNKSTYNITVKEEALLVHLQGVRAIMMKDKCLIFDPDTVNAKKFMEVLAPRLQAPQSDGRLRNKQHQNGDQPDWQSEGATKPPFELECLEGAFTVAVGRLDAEMDTATRRMAGVLKKLPREITPVNLEELRRVKQALVEVESKADQLRDMVEEIMDDEDEVRDLNLSSRPLREERRRARERERLERGMARHDQQSIQSNSSSSRANRNESTPKRRADSESSRQYDDAEEEYQEAEAALEEMDEAEQEEQEVEEVEDLLEYYLQRAANTQAEAERLLEGARDLEESIGVSLSARRFEVNRLELTLSIGSFAAGLGAMIAGIFGMNLTSTLEASVIGFWGTTFLIVFGCMWICWALYTYTRRRRIL